MKTIIIQKLCVLAFVLIAGTIRSFSQVPEIEWQKSFGGSGGDYGYAAIPTSDGGYIVAGQTSSNNQQVHGNHGMEDYWIVKLNASGDTLWTKTYGGSATDYARYIQQTTDGGYVVVGTTNSIDGDITFNHGDYDFWVLRLNAAGEIIWQKTYGGSLADFAFFIQQTADLGYILCGTSHSNNFDVSGNHAAGDCWVLKIDSSGEIEWQNALGGGSLDEAYCVRQTTDGNYIMAGFAGSDDGDVHNNHNVTDFWVVKLNPLGDTLWTKTYGGPNYDKAGSIRETADGGFIIAGHATVNGDDVHGVHGNNFKADYWIVKINSSGDTLWTKALGGSNHDFASFIQQTSDGGYIVGGHASSNDGDVSGNHGFYDAWLVKLDSSGETLWTKTIGGTSDDAVMGGQTTDDCGYVIYGYSGSNDFDITGNHGDVDFFVMKLDADVALFKTFYADSDGDGFGDAGSPTLSCSAQNGYVSNSTDCNDALASVHPNTTETCNGVDDNCNAQIDEGVKSTFYADADGDSFGNVSVKTKACVAPSGYVSNSTDCDDANAAIHPAATEICNGADDNCNAQIDEGVKSTFYADADGDGYGNFSVTTESCAAPSGYVSNSTDCDDANAAINPIVAEVCNGVDDNCNGQVDENCEVCEVPVALNTIQVTETSAKLEWDPVNTAVSYKVRYRIAGASEWIVIRAKVNQKILSGLTANTQYIWQVRSVCGSQPAAPSGWSEKQFFTTGALRTSEGAINENMLIPEDFFRELYPNPVMQYAVVSFSLHEASEVLIIILDMNGRVLRVIADQNFSEGNHEVTFHRESLVDGIYLVQMKTNEGAMIKKMVIHQ